MGQRDGLWKETPESYWYYLGSNGKAYRASNSGRASFRTITKANGDVKKYAFDDRGCMLSGWLDESGERQTGENAWKYGVYYCGDETDGARVDDEWWRLEVTDDETDDYDFDGSYWFYFDRNGKKTANRQRYINKYKYLFDENGAASYSWNEQVVTGTPSDAYYNLPSQCWLATGWFKTVPSEDNNPEAFDDEEEKWFYYSEVKKDLIRSQIKSINNHKYGFNENGEMLYGLYKMKMADSTILDYQKIEAEEQLPEDGEDWEVYYFGDSPKEGVMATGRTYVTLEGEKFTFFFRKNKTKDAGVGSGVKGIYEGSIYEQGNMLKAENGLRYQVIEYNGDPYLVNTSGKIQKNKKNIKDAEDTYYSTDKNGIVIDSGYEKE